jgi:electron transfer flavoprotein alpha subunit
LELIEATKGQETIAILFGSEGKAAATELQKFVSEVFWIGDSAFDSYHSEAYAKALEVVVKEASPSLLLGNSSSMGKDLLPKVAARFDASVAADCVSIHLQNGVQVSRPFYSGKAMGTLEFSTDSSLKVVSLRPNSLVVGDLPVVNGKLTEKKIEFDFANSPLQFVEKKIAASSRPDLSEAPVVVSGGRSLKSSENFKLVFDLADAFGGAAGASRAAVDEGLVPHEMQVGQTGKTVNPKLYIACGISGAIQHLAGMRTSKVIVAINKDREAPIFGKADYGLVGDLFEILPALTAEVKKTLSS